MTADFENGTPGSGQIGFFGSCTRYPYFGVANGTYVVQPYYDDRVYPPYIEYLHGGTGGSVVDWPLRNIRFQLFAGWQGIAVRVIANPYDRPWDANTGWMASSATYDEILTVPPNGNIWVTVPSPVVRTLRILPLYPNWAGGPKYFAIDNFSYEYGQTTQFELGLDLDSVAYPTGVKMLVSKHGGNDEYPQPNEQEPPDSLGRPRMRIRGSVRDKATGVAPKTATTIYLRLRDPKDSAPYVPSGMAIEGDNIDKAAMLSKAEGTTVGVWDCDPKPGVTCPTKEFLEIVLGANQGDFEVLLTGSAYAAGDNYQVEATLRQSATCLPPDCATSATITMWKRIYVERTNMFRSGGQVAEDIDPAQMGPVSKVHVTPAKSFEPHQIIRFVHSPKLDGTGDQTYYSDDRKIVSTVATGSNKVTLTLDQPLDRMYYARDAGAAPVSEDGADGVGVLVDGSYPEADLIITEDLLSRAFVELVPLAATATSTLAPVYQMTEDAGLALGKKWFRNRAMPNHFLFASAATNDLGDLGATHTLQRGTIWLYMRPAESYSLLAYVQRFTLMSEVASHEMGHGWAVNSDPTKLKILPSGHCEHPRFDDSSKACIMARSYFFEYPKTTAFDFENNYPAPEFYNGTVNYHTNKVGSDFDSEFMEIRRREDPVPNR